MQEGGRGDEGILRQGVELWDDDDDDDDDDYDENGTTTENQTTATTQGKQAKRE